jgi:hypothetical protein
MAVPSTPPQDAGHSSQASRSAVPTRAPDNGEAAHLINLTGGSLVVIGDGDEVRLAPLETVELHADRAEAFDDEVIERDPRLDMRDAVPVEAEEKATAAVGLVSFMGLVAGIAVGVAFGWGWALLAWVVVTTAGVFISRTVRAVGAGAIAGWLAERALLVLVVATGFGSALVAAWLGNIGAESPADAFRGVNAVVLFLVGVQAVFLGFAIVFPGLLYFFFERQRAEALRTRFLLNVFRLDDRLATVPEVEARYGSRMKSLFGEGQSGVLQARRLSPILVCTMVLSVSMVAAFVKLRDPAAAGEGTDAAVGDTLLSVLTPTAEVLPFAFLGAYLYAVNTSLRGYLRGDLRPKAYSQIAGRMLIVVALAALLSAFTSASNATWGQWLVLAAAFFVGLVPNTFITRMFEVVRQRFTLRADKVGEPQPLTALQGIDLYDRARLEQEGVTNVEALVHGDLIDLMTQTRIPAGRLVDWLDQAVLHLHLPTSGTPATQATVDDLVARRIRSASHLLEAVGYRLQPGADGLLEVAPPDAAPATGAGLLPAYQHVVEGIAAEPVMRRVMCWKLDRHLADARIDARGRHGDAGAHDASAPTSSVALEQPPSGASMPAPRTPEAPTPSPTPV